jgi:hypothetical protein
MLRAEAELEIAKKDPNYDLTDTFQRFILSYTKGDLDSNRANTQSKDALFIKIFALHAQRNPENAEETLGTLPTALKSLALAGMARAIAAEKTRA